jgi:hypothetical protein
LNWVERKPFFEYDWRASLVPAAAVIPAPIVYLNVVAVKKLVVEFLSGPTLLGGAGEASALKACLPNSSRGKAHFTLNKLECSRQALLEYYSME